MFGFRVPLDAEKVGPVFLKPCEQCCGELRSLFRKSIENKNRFAAGERNPESEIPAFAAALLGYGLIDSKLDSLPYTRIMEYVSRYLVEDIRGNAELMSRYKRTYEKYFNTLTLKPWGLFREAEDLWQQQIKEYRLTWGKNFNVPAATSELYAALFYESVNAPTLGELTDMSSQYLTLIKTELAIVRKKFRLV